LQSANDVQGPQDPLTHAWPFWHPAGGLQLSFGGVAPQIPDWQESPGAQSGSDVQVHWTAT
jgi:hypothetical protein